MSHRRAKKERRQKKSHGPSKKPGYQVPVFLDDQEPVYGDPTVGKALKQLVRRRGRPYTLK